MPIQTMKCMECSNQNASLFIRFPNGGYTCRCCNTYHYYTSEEEYTKCEIGFDHLRCYQFGEALITFQNVLQLYPDSIQALWGFLLAKFRVVFIQGFYEKKVIDNNIFRKVTPIYCFENYKALKRITFQSDEYYQKLKQILSDRPEALATYEKQAKEIDKAIATFKGARKKSPRDIFICVKNSVATESNPDVQGKTADFEEAKKLYKELTDKGANVFFSFVTLKGGTIQTDDEIWTALLNSEKMLLITSNHEYLQSAWVKSEWERWIRLGRGERLFIYNLNKNGLILPPEFDGLSIQAYTPETRKNLIEHIYPQDHVLPTPAPIQPKNETPPPQTNSKKKSSAIIPFFMATILICMLFIGLALAYRINEAGSNDTEQTPFATMAQETSSSPSNTDTQSASASQTTTALAEYTITFHANGGTGTMANNYLKDGSLFYLPNCKFVRTDYYCIGWATSPNANSPEYEVGEILPIDRNYDLYACWEQTYYKITYHSIHTGSDDFTTSHASGTLVSLVSETDCHFSRSGYRFDGWSATPNAKTAKYKVGDKIVVKNDISLYAVWTKLYTVKLVSGFMGSEDIIATKSIAEGDTYTIPASLENHKNWTFDGWSDGNDINKQNTDLTVNGNITLYGVWTPKTYGTYLLKSHLDVSYGWSAREEITCNISEDFDIEALSALGYKYQITVTYTQHKVLFKNNVHCKVYTFNPGWSDVASGGGSIIDQEHATSDKNKYREYSSGIQTIPGNLSAFYLTFFSGALEGGDLTDLTLTIEFIK